MTGAVVLLVFLLVLSIGISTILYVSKDTTHFNLMTGWGLFAYIVFAIAILACVVDAIPNGG